MAPARQLLTFGNGKTGEGCHTWSLPALEATVNGEKFTVCVGASSACIKACYARRGRYRSRILKTRLQWNLDQALRDDWGDRVAWEIRERGVMALRWHVSGEIFSRSYAEMMLGVMRKRPKTRYWMYTRSWVDASIAPVLAEMAALKQCAVWYSVDAAMEWPQSVPAGAKIAYLQTGEDDRPTGADLVFRIKRLRTQPRRLGLSVIKTCPEEQDRSLNCCSCRACLPN